MIVNNQPRGVQNYQMFKVTSSSRKYINSGQLNW